MNIMVVNVVTEIFEKAIEVFFVPLKLSVSQFGVISCVLLKEKLSNFHK